MLPRVTNFNSIKVQLEPEFGLYKSQIDDFNSIKVQLERSSIHVGIVSVAISIP